MGPLLDGSMPGTAVIRDTDGGKWDGDATFDRGIGPMGFLPGSWTEWGKDGNGDKVADPNNVFDAATAAGYVLCSAGDLSTPAMMGKALLRYNHSASYVELVLKWAATYRDGVTPTADSTGTVPAVADAPHDDPAARPAHDVHASAPATTTAPPKPPTSSTTTHDPSNPPPSTPPPTSSTTTAPPSTTTTAPPSTTTTPPETTTSAPARPPPRADRGFRRRLIECGPNQASWAHGRAPHPHRVGGAETKPVPDRPGTCPDRGPPGATERLRYVLHGRSRQAARGVSARVTPEPPHRKS